MGGSYSFSGTACFERSAYLAFVVLKAGEMKRTQTALALSGSSQGNGGRRTSSSHQRDLRRQEQRIRSTLGSAARMARLRSGLTQADVAETIGTVTEVYGRMERGKLLPSVPTLFRLCMALHSGPHELLGFAPVGRPGAKAPGVDLKVPRSLGDSPEIRRLVRRLGRLERSQLRLVQLIVASLVERRMKGGKRAAAA
jgi:DNA-binding XRE family transcriptional regulator